MRAKQFLPEAPIGVNQKRPSRPGSRPERGHEPQKRYVTDRKTGKQYDPDEEFDKLKNSPEFQAQMKRMAQKEDISGSQETKFHAKLDKLVHDTFGKREDEIEEIAGAFPSPSTREKWAKDAAVSNAAEAKRQADIKAKADAERLRVNNAIVDKEQRINYHPMPDNEVPTKESINDLEDLLEKASRQLCKSAKPDSELGASNLASCKSQGLRARDGEKSHLIGHGNSSVRVTVGGKKIKGKKYGGPLPDYGTRKGQ